jgi:hypothetical protein
MFGEVGAKAAERRSGARAPSAAEAERAVELMAEMNRDLRGCAIVGPGNKPLAASGEPSLWAEATGRLLGAARATREGDPPVHVHVGTEEGEAFVVRGGELTMVAVTERFTLTSLVLSDMRSLLRDLAAGEVADHRAPERGEVPAMRETDEEIVEGGPEAATPPAA